LIPGYQLIECAIIDLTLCFSLIASDKSAGAASTATDAPALGKVIPATTAVNTKDGEKDGKSSRR
jgi:hypothetical protein